VELFDASRFAMAMVETAGLPRSMDDVPGEPDYENPVQASPVARPHTASINVTNAQVYGDSPAEWNKARRVDFVRRVAAALERRLADTPVPVVLVADTEIGGHFQKVTTLGPFLAGVIDVNPASLDLTQLHSAAYALMQPRFDQARRKAVERFETLLRGRDARAVTDIAQVVKAASDGRVDTLFLTEDEGVQGRNDGTNNTFAPGGADGVTGEDHIETAAVQTLEQGGAVQVLAREEMPAGTLAAAMLRY
jgi:hypothetical protein